MIRLVAPSLGALILLSAWKAPAPVLPQDPPTLQSVVKRYNAERATVMERMNAAATPEERMEIYRGADRMGYITDLQEVTFQEAGTDTAAEAFVWIVRIGKEFHPDEAREAVEILIEVHPESEQLEALVNELQYPKELGLDFAESSLRSIGMVAEMKVVQASSQFGLAALLMGGHWDEAKNKSKRAEAREVLIALQKNFKGVGNIPLNAERALYEIDHLQVGMIAPDFEAVDAVGANFKLSDYRGKVTVIDFWGFW